MPHYTTKDGIFDCSKCSTRFKSRAGGLTSHVMWAHPSTSVSSSSSSSSITTAPAVPRRERTIEMDVELVMNRVLIDVENECRKSRGGRKGAQKRKSYDFSYKMDVINELDAGTCAEDVALKMNINKSLVSKWKDARKTIIDNAASSHLKLLKKGRKSKKHNALFERLIVKFRAARKKGNMVSFNWIYTHANKLQKEMYSGSPRLSPGVVTFFI